MTHQRFKANRIKDDLLFYLITEDIALAELGNTLRIQPVGAVSDLILHKQITNRCGAVLLIHGCGRHRIDAIAAKGLRAGV